MTIDFNVGWVEFTQDEVQALNQAAQAVNTLWELHTQPTRAELVEERAQVVKILHDAAEYISVNIGAANPANPYLPANRVQGFKDDLITFLWLGAAQRVLKSIYLTLPRPVRLSKDAVHAYAEADEALQAMQAHLDYALRKRFPTLAYKFW
jgi:hypothetical protein